jgi:hypothetical protein
VVLHYPGLVGKAKQYTISDLSHAFFLSVMLRALQTTNTPINGLSSQEVDGFIKRFTALDPNNGATQFLLPALDRAKDPMAANQYLYKNAQGVKSRSEPVLPQACVMPHEQVQVSAEEVAAQFLDPGPSLALASGAGSVDMDASYAYCGNGFDFDFGSSSAGASQATGGTFDIRTDLLGLPSKRPASSVNFQANPDQKQQRQGEEASSMMNLFNS